MVGPADKVARAAAQRFLAGEAVSIRDAVDQARAESGETVSPSVATVRRHLEGLRQASMGMEAWRAQRLSRLDALEELLQTIAYLAPECTCYVTGRAAEGHVDDTGAAIIRVVGADSGPQLMDDLEAHDVPPFDVENRATRIGSIAVAHVNDEALHADLLLLPDRPEAHAAASLVDGRAVAIVDEVAFARLVEDIRSNATVV
ncbi:MAG: hypothetical protein QF561_07500 [Phycisphaerales bacterium]|jgi:hypothetical protein|nr:hypothetical protein [Phycisphaerales bacterium]